MKKLERIEISEPNAHVKLSKRLVELQDRHNIMKSVNLIFKRDMPNKEKRLRDIGVREEEINDLLCNSGYSTNELKSARMAILKTEARLEEISKISERRPVDDMIFIGVRYIEDPEAKRICFVFDEWPDPKITKRLMKNGFNYSPSKKRFQRRMTLEALGKIRQLKSFLSEHY